MLTTHQLQCLIEGEDIVFTVIAASDDNVSDLKKSIQKERVLDSLKDVRPHTLELWKVKDSHSIAAEPEDSLVERIRLLGHDLSKFADKLGASRTVFGTFPTQPHNDYIHIIVKVPRTATITPSSLGKSNLLLNSPPSWLVEIHNELWGQHDFLGKIFRTTTVTKDDFTELQHLLESLNPGRNSDEYVPEDVLVTKSTFLRERSTGLDLDLVDGLVPRPVLGACQSSSSDVVDDDGVVGDDNDVVDDDDVMDDDGAVGDDNDVVDDDDVMDDDDGATVTDFDTHLPNEAMAIFPYTIRYVDLTVLQSKERLRVPRLMLFRNEWGTMIDIFNKRKKGTDGSALFSGQPGIGKTCMLYSILILCIILARPIVFQDIDGMVFIIGNTVRPLGAQGVSIDADDVLTLVDADDTVCQPNKYLFRHKEYRILLISTPKKNKDRRWLTQRVGDSYGMFMMMPWSREELVVASLFLQSNDITPKRLQEASCICGNIPRECFTAALSPRHLSWARDNIGNAIRQTYNLPHAIINMKAGGETVIHRVFQIRPLSEGRMWNSCRVEPVSDWAFSEMMDALDERRAGSAYEFYCAIKGWRDGSQLARKSFENHLHKFLKTSSQTFTIESLDNRFAALEIRFTSNTKRFGDMKCFSGHLALSVESETSCYLQPLSPVFPSFDSFLYRPGFSQSGFSCLIGLQVTTAANHTIKIKGLENVQMSLKPNVCGMKDLRPTIKKKLIILFVVPETLGVIFAKQTIEGAKQATQDTKKGKKKEKEPLWYRKTAQYILVLPEEEVFKAR